MRMSEGLYIRIHKSISATLQLDQKTAYLTRCQSVVNQLIRGWTSAYSRGCVSNSLKTSLKSISGLFVRHYLYNIGCLQGIFVFCLRLNISVDKWSALSTYSLVAMSYCNDNTIDCTFCYTSSTFDIYYSCYLYSDAAYISNYPHILWYMLPSICLSWTLEAFLYHLILCRLSKYLPRFTESAWMHFKKTHLYLRSQLAIQPSLCFKEICIKKSQF